MKYYDQEEQLVPVISGERYLSVFLTPFPVGEIRNFRCVNCGKLLFQYESEVAAVMDSPDKPKSKPSFEVMCHRCRVVYRVIE